MLNNNEYLDKLYQSDKPIIIYKNDNGFDVYTDFSKKIIVDKKNIKNFLNIQTQEKSSSIDDLNCYIGFFGY
ncbi:aminodeoxychorismate synthase component I, partial [Pelagibacteraceae bacterium]|nr:aminodeoxychorismate synthase component I [Pelagibacteraceae bacterium]